MKKYLLPLLTFFLLISAAFAKIDPLNGVNWPPREKPTINKYEAMIDRINAALEDRTDLPERKIAYLEHRRDLLSLQVEMRKAFREAMKNLSKDATKEERRSAARSVRDQFAEDLKGIKKGRREFMKRRRANRDSKA
tara:strand:- start:1341 stop:1751 length:411 start_codon:yes stop_codon:yes gene_type:complete